MAESILADTLPANARANFIAAPPLARFVFRGDADAAAIAGKAYGLDFPEAVNRAASKGERGKPGGRVALRLGPDEVLLIVPVNEGKVVGAAIAAACADLPHALIDISDRHLGFVLEGHEAADLIATGCPLDLDERAFPVGMATRTLFHKAEIVLWRMAPAIFRIEVARSFTSYLEASFQKALIEYL